jgi:hypothetical protein
MTITTSLTSPHAKIDWAKRWFPFFVIMFAFLPALARASDDCSPNNQVSEIVARKHTTLRGPFSVEELEKDPLRFSAANEAWLKFKAAIKPDDQIYQVVIRDGIFRADYHILVRNGCARRTLMGSIT